MKKIIFTSLFLLFTLLCLSSGFAGAMDTLTVPQLADKIVDVEKKEITLTGKIAGACMSGCKVWVTADDYKKGDRVILVWAKDDAFKFKTDAAGQKVRLKGFAVAKYIDLCATEKKQEEGIKEGESCAKPEMLKNEQEKKIDSITFFATMVEYL